MRVVYQFKIEALCPRDEEISDQYDAVVTYADQWHPVEDILDAVREYKKVPIFQEHLAGDLLKTLPGKPMEVKLIGIHSDVEVIVTCTG